MRKEQVSAHKTTSRAPARPKANPVGEYDAPGVVRTMSVLEALRDHPAGLTLSELVRLTKLALNTAHRTALTLTELGYLERLPDSKVFRLTPKLLTFSRSVQGGHLVEQALGPLRALRDETQETTLFGTLTDGAGVILEQAPGTRMFRFVAEIGRLLPLHTAAPCKAMLAWLPEPELLRRLEKMTFPRFTDHTLTSRKAFLAELAAARQAGYAADREEDITGVCCIGAPVFNRQGYPVASLWITGQAEHLGGPYEAALAAAVRRHADIISERLGFHPASPPNVKALSASARHRDTGSKPVESH
jgi:DNA-binding IclR family transcriptional regulator